MKIKFWGVRGSLPSPGPNTVEFGGNTPCIQVVTEGEDDIIFDAGTGIRELGLSLLQKKRPLKIHLFLTHTHWDHIMGFPFFIPIFLSMHEIHIYGPAHHNKGIKDIVTDMMDYEFFPVSAMSLSAKVFYHDLKEEEFTIGEYKIRTHFMNHPVFMLGYRIEHKGQSVVYTGDHEPFYDFISDSDITIQEREESEDVKNIINLLNDRTVEFSKDADILICDTTYTNEEYAKKQGWGHSTFEQGYQLAGKARVKHLILFHHEPTRSDKDLRQIELDIQKKLADEKPEFPKKITASREGMEVET